MIRPRFHPSNYC